MTSKRPTLLTIICILGFSWVVLGFPEVFSPSIKKLGDWYPALFGFIVAASFISFIGVWHMKRWGVQLFIVTFFIKEMVLVLVDEVNYIGIGFSLTLLFFMIFFYNGMDENL